MKSEGEVRARLERHCWDCAHSTVAHRFGIFCNLKKHGVSGIAAMYCNDFKMLGGGGGG